MHGNRMLTVTALATLAAFQALFGCNSAPAPSSASPSAPAPAQAPQAKGNSPIIHLGVNVAAKWETHHRIAANESILWRASDKDGQFYVEFEAANNPCDPDQFGDVQPAPQNVYNSKEVSDPSGSGKHWEARCKLSKTSTAVKPWQYGVGSGKRTRDSDRHVIPCNGCVLGDDPYTDE
jgi:hypothetical protein